MYSPRSSDRLLINLGQRSDEMSDPNAAMKAPESLKLRPWTQHRIIRMIRSSYDMYCTHTYIHTVPPFDRFFCPDKEEISGQSLVI